MEPTLLQYPDFSKECCIITDAVLTQNHNGLQLPIAYASRAFTKGESNKCTTDHIFDHIFMEITLLSKQITDH